MWPPLLRRATKTLLTSYKMCFMTYTAKICNKKNLLKGVGTFDPTHQTPPLLGQFSKFSRVIFVMAPLRQINICQQMIQIYACMSCIQFYQHNSDHYYYYYPDKLIKVCLDIDINIIMFSRKLVFTILDEVDTKFYKFY